MKKAIKILINTFSLTMAMSLLIGQLGKTVAQVGETNSQESSQENNQPIQEEIKNPETQQQQRNLENREEQLERELQINQKKPNASTVEEEPAPPESQSPNVPKSPESEVEVNF